MVLKSRAHCEMFIPRIDKKEVIFCPARSRKRDPALRIPNCTSKGAVFALFAHSLTSQCRQGKNLHLISYELEKNNLDEDFLRGYLVRLTKCSALFLKCCNIIYVKGIFIFQVSVNQAYKNS